jgi:hypothetical protein
MHRFASAAEALGKALVGVDAHSHVWQLQQWCAQSIIQVLQ